MPNGVPAGESISPAASPTIFHSESIAIQTCTDGILSSSHDNGSVEILSVTQGAPMAPVAGKFDL